jgi:hypothetical protein
MSTRRSTTREDQTAPIDSAVTTPRTRNATKRRIPFWDNEKRTLFFHKKIIKVFRTRAQNQLKIIKKFETEGWRDRIDNPLSKKNDEASRTQLYQALKRLNSNQKQANIRFRCDGTGHGIIWERNLS